jgi:hypothetical protein
MRAKVAYSRRRGPLPLAAGTSDGAQGPLAIKEQKEILMSSTADRLQAIVSTMSPELQQEVLDFAQYLRATRIGPVEPGEPPRFYICPICFTAAEQRLMCHDHLMMPCYAESLEDCKPMMDSEGQLKTRAPRWFVKTRARFGE